MASNKHLVAGREVDQVAYLHAFGQELAPAPEHEDAADEILTKQGSLEPLVSFDRQQGKALHDPTGEEPCASFGRLPRGGVYLAMHQRT